MNCVTWSSLTLPFSDRAHILVWICLTVNLGYCGNEVIKAAVFTHSVHFFLQGETLNNAAVVLYCYISLDSELSTLCDASLLEAWGG